MDYERMDCTKLRNFLEEKSVAWMSENVSLADLIIIQGKAYACSPQAYAEISGVINFLKHKLAREEIRNR